MTTGQVAGGLPIRAIAAGVALIALAATGVVLVLPDAVSVVTYLSYTLVGSYLVLRRPRNAVGWLLIACGWLHVSTSTGPPPSAAEALLAGTADPVTALRAWAGSAVGSLLFVAYAAILLVFPSGTIPAGRGGRRLAITLVVVAIAVVVPAFLVSRIPFAMPDGTELAIPNPYVVVPVVDDPASGLLVALVTAFAPIALLAIIVGHTIRRYRRSDGITRLQLRWLMASVAFVAAAVTFGLLVAGITGERYGILGWLPVIVAYPLIPVAIGIAVMRYRLFEIDRLLSRTIAYALITAVLFAVFAVVNLSLQSVLGSVVRGNAIGVAVSTLVVAALFQPLRIRLQAIVDRRFNRTRRDHEAVVTRFASGLRHEMDVDRVVDATRRAAEEAVEPSAATVWQRRRRVAT